MPNLTKHDITAARHRRRMDLRVTTQEQAGEFVDDVGFCFLFPIQNVNAAYIINTDRTRWAG